MLRGLSPQLAPPLLHPVLRIGAGFGAIAAAVQAHTGPAWRPGGAVAVPIGAPVSALSRPAEPCWRGGLSFGAGRRRSYHHGDLMYDPLENTS